jgi:hypothetical protein
LTPVAYRGIPIPGTDHEMILATFDSPSNQRGKGYWKCNVEALRDEKGSLEPMERFIEDEWAQMDPNVSAAERWDSLKKKITQEVKRRAKEKNARKKHTLKETVEKLAKHKKLLRAATKTEDRKKARENIDGLKLKLEDINAYRFMGAKVKSRSKWYAHTERPTREWLQRAARDAKQSSISKMTTAEELETDSPKVMAKELQEFYSKLYDRRETDYEALHNLIEDLRKPENFEAASNTQTDISVDVVRMAIFFFLSNSDISRS